MPPVMFLVDFHPTNTICPPSMRSDSERDSLVSKLVMRMTHEQCSSSDSYDMFTVASSKLDGQESNDALHIGPRPAKIA